VPDQIERVQRVLDEAHAMIESASPAALSKQTPCSEWDVRGLIDHMIGVVNNFSAGFGGGQLTPPSGTAGLSGENPAAAYRQAVDNLMAALRQPGALDKTLKLPFGEMPGRQAIGIAIGDQSIHTWDLGKALGKPHTIDEGVATDVLGMLHQILTPDRRGPGKAFAAEVPCAASAPAGERLLAFSGRQP
jgi:uncharacterized protein (TIGR03086 family)